MTKLIVILVSFLFLSACEQQKQASVEVGAVPKQILEKATSDINNAAAVAAEQAKAAEDLDAPAAAKK